VRTAWELIGFVGVELGETVGVAVIIGVGVGAIVGEGVMVGVGVGVTTEVKSVTMLLGRYSTRLEK